MKTPPANQLTFALFATPIVTSNGDGSVTVKPGKPSLWLTPKQMGAQFGVNRASVYRWRDEGLIGAEFVRFAGKRKILISAEAVASLEKYFQGLRE